jgi:hypothetical protein
MLMGGSMVKSVSFKRAEYLHGLLLQSRCERVSRNELHRLVETHVGAEQRTVRKYTKLMLKWGFINATGNPNVFNVAQMKAYRLERVLASADSNKEDDEPP